MRQNGFSSYQTHPRNIGFMYRYFNHTINNIKRLIHLWQIKKPHRARRNVAGFIQAVFLSQLISNA